jgi:hypothetical protein
MTHHEVCKASYFPFIVKVLDYIRAQPHLFETIKNVNKIMRERFGITKEGHTLAKHLGVSVIDTFQIIDMFLQDFANNPKPILDVKDPRDKILLKKFMTLNSWLIGVQGYFGYQNMAATPYLQKIKENVLAKAAAYRDGTLETSKLKFFLISAHDITIQNALPDFLSNLCYEKYLNDPKFLDADYDPEIDCRHSAPLASKLVYELVESNFFSL